ncbi:MAG TPA: GGDEF domain-containing protein [Polyangiaceae bacterium]|nr:GGDEF domain-containing protein [Polyangiaceae bacterium]
MPLPLDPDEDESTALISLESIGRLPRREPKDRHLLVRVKGQGLGHVTRLNSAPCVVGRAPDCGLYVGDDGVSRRHAMLVPLDDSYLLVDTESANGTFVGGQRVERHVLKDGDWIQFGAAAAFRYTQTDSSQETLLRQLFEASVTDALTGCFNREYLDSQLKSELSYARRHKTEVSLVLFDVDHFKKVNDNYGHQAGDQVLIQIAQTISKMVRNEDVFARYGGEEFAVVVRAIGLAGAASLAERLRAAVAALEIPTERGAIRVTISLGVASSAALEDLRPEGLIRVADERLYAAKHGGRNRVVSSG